MREIKFRAWDNVGKCMIPWEAMMQTAFNNEKMNFLYDIMCGYRLDVELMQFTGLHDKNGKEIYEGDIIIYDSDIPWEIIWRDEVSSFAGRSINGTLDSIALTRFCVVIGNIYENPELLK